MISQETDPLPPAAEPSGAEGTSSSRWIVELVIAGVVIGLLSGLTFHFTARRMFARAAADAGGTPGVTRPDPKRAVVSLEHGLAMYAANCASCHGVGGLGDGPQAEALVPRPRNFASGSFKIGTTPSGLPTDDDLVKSIRHGMLPAMMPPWPQLTDGELRSLAMAVRHLAIEGRVTDKLRRDPAFGREKALAVARAALDSRPPIVLPPKPASLDLERGKTFYANNCAMCHDPDGRGKLREDLVDNEENPIQARDLTTGVYKGGDSLDDIAMRIVRGMPGGPMPANPSILPEDLWSTAVYVKSFANVDPTNASRTDTADPLPGW